MAGTMTTASGQSSLFMITHSVALCPGRVRPRATGSSTQNNRRPPGWGAATAFATFALSHVECGYIR
jgi:hypothetical protein